MAYGLRKLGGVTQIYRTTTASARNVATRFREVVANNWSQQAQRSISEEEIDVPYRAMEDEAEPSASWMEEAEAEARRERNLTRYNTENDGKAPPMEEAQGDAWGKPREFQWGSATIEDAGSSWSVWPDAPDPVSLTVRPSDFDTLASLLEQKEIMRSQGPLSVEASQVFTARIDKMIGWTKQKLSTIKADAEEPLLGEANMPTLKIFTKLGKLIERAKASYAPPPEEYPGAFDEQDRRSLDMLKEEQPVEEKVPPEDDPFDALEARANKFLETSKQDIQRWQAADAQNAEAKEARIEKWLNEMTENRIKAENARAASEQKHDGPPDGEEEMPAAEGEGADVAGAASEVLEQAGVEVAEEVGLC